MSPDGPSDQQGKQPVLPARPLSAAAERNRRRQRLLSVQDFCASIAFDNPKVRYRYREGMQLGTLPVPIERAVLEIAYGAGGSIDKRLLEALGATHRGLFTLLLRKPLTEDPLAEVKPVEAKVIIDQPAQPEPAPLPPRPSIVPPSRPKRVGRATLKPGEEELV